MTDQYTNGSEYRNELGDDLSEFDARMLHSTGFWPMMQPDADDGGPYIAEFGDIRSLHFDHRTIQSEMNIADPLRLELDYIRVMMGFLLFNPNPRNIDMIG